MTKTTHYLLTKNQKAQNEFRNEIIQLQIFKTHFMVDKIMENRKHKIWQAD